jgi:UDP-N-acetylglucosamine acyltransferase
MLIHPTAIIDPTAKIGDNVSIGAYTVVGADVEIGNETSIGPHVIINGPTVIGKRNKIFQFASVGEQCQDLKYKGEPTRLIIGDDNTIREGATLHRGTIQDEHETRIGSHCLLMVNTHVAHDCVVGDHVIMANNTGIAGHCHVGDHAILGGNSGVHQFCQVGAHAFVGMGSVVVKDVPAFVTVQGYPATPHGMNFEGMKRRGFSRESIKSLRQAYKVVYREGKTVKEAITELEETLQMVPELKLFIDSVQSSRRGIAR